MNKKKERAQTSFEVIVITSLLIVIIISALRIVPALATSTGEIAIVKSEALNILNKQDKFYYIAEVKEPVTHTGTHNITLVIGGNTVDPTLEGTLEGISQKLDDLNIVEGAVINVEQAP